MATKQIVTLFFDIGGVLLTNGWDHNMHIQVCKKLVFVDRSQSITQLEIGVPSWEGSSGNLRCKFRDVKNK